MKNNLLHWIFVFTLSFGVMILVQFLFREYRNGHLNDLGHVGKFEFVLYSILLPLYLTSIYWLFYKRLSINLNFKSYLLLAVLCIIFSSRLDFVNWWNSEGKVLSVKDAEGRDLIEIGLILQCVLALIISTITLFGIRRDNTGIKRFEIQKAANGGDPAVKKA